MADDGSIQVAGAAVEPVAVGRVVIVGAGPAGASRATDEILDLGAALRSDTITVGRMTMTTIPSVVHSDPDILGGTPVFVGTRVPVRSLLDYLAAGDTLEEFLDHFPTVSREQAVAALSQANELLVSHAHSA